MRGTAPSPSHRFAAGPSLSPKWERERRDAAQTPLPFGECRVEPAPGRLQIVRGTIGPTLEGPAPKALEGEGQCA
jgi:hypothetical protein